jgi:prepilin-type N-terminal cleavage/methylation domain-containing protein
MPKVNSKQKGFTLIELLVVIGILGILLAIVLIAINPAAQFAQANNTARTNDVNTILNAVHQYGADHRGNLTTLGLTATPTDISDAAGGDICAMLVPDYVSLMPVDPDTNDGIALTETDCEPADTYNTSYQISQDASGRVTVAAPDAETVRGTTPVISVTR